MLGYHFYLNRISYNDGKCDNRFSGIKLTVYRYKIISIFVHAVNISSAAMTDDRVNNVFD